MFLAFERARDAVAAAADLQRALDAERGPRRRRSGWRSGSTRASPSLSGRGLRRDGRARRGPHLLGRPRRSGRRLTGDARARRRRRQGRPSFRRLGSHRLKHVPTPQALFQLVAPGLEESFPPLATLGGATLPALHHRLVGRGGDLARRRRCSHAPMSGSSRSRGRVERARAASRSRRPRAAAVERPVHLVGLASISDAALVPAAIARVVGVRESPGSRLDDLLAEALEGTGALLVLDNFEHCGRGARGLRAARPRLRISTFWPRAALRCGSRASMSCRLRPLPAEDATTFFLELAAAQGVPLDVRVASGRGGDLPPPRRPAARDRARRGPPRPPPADGALRALDEGLALEMEGPVDLPQRQRTLHATLGWSYGLLTDSQRRLHGLLAVFAGGSTLEDARAVAGSPAGFLADLEALVAGEPVRRDAGEGAVRLSMLETVREDAVARLAEAGHARRCRRRHAERFLAFAGEAEDGLAGPEQAALARARRTGARQHSRSARLVPRERSGGGSTSGGVRARPLLARPRPRHRGPPSPRPRPRRGRSLPADVRARALWTAAHEAMAQSDYRAAVPALRGGARDLPRARRRPARGLRAVRARACPLVA